MAYVAHYPTFKELEELKDYIKLTKFGLDCPFASDTKHKLCVDCKYLGPELSCFLLYNYNSLLRPIVECLTEKYPEILL